MKRTRDAADEIDDVDLDGGEEVEEAKADEARPRRRGRKKVELPDGLSFERLADALHHSRAILLKYLAKRRENVKQYAGPHYADGAVSYPIPVNLISMYISIVSRSLVAKEPMVMLSTHDRTQQPAVSTMQDWMNEDAVEMGLADVFHRSTIDALFLYGVVMVALADEGDAAGSNWGLEAGTPFIDVVDPEDFVIDMDAKRFKDATYMGRRFRIPLRMAEKIYEPKEELVEDENSSLTTAGHTHLGTIGKGEESRQDIEPCVTLWEIYLPRYRKVVTLRDENGFPTADHPLRVQDWVGPECGPYHLHGLGVVPGNLIPKGPVMDLMDLHLACNRTYRKVIEEADNFKKILPVKGGQMDSAGNVKQAMDGEIIQADNAESMKEVSFGGPDPTIVLFADQLRNLFSFVGGNLEILGGRAPQARTATQDKILDKNAAGGVADFQASTIRFISQVYRAYAWFCWHHPQKVMESQYKVPGFKDYAITRRLFPHNPGDPDSRAAEAEGEMTRHGPMPKLNVDPYSVRHVTPEERSEFVSALLAEMTPLMGLLQQNGITFDANEFLDFKARCHNEPAIKDVFKYQEPVVDEATGGAASGGPEGPQVPNKTTEIVRRSVGNQSQQAQAADFTSQMQAAASAGGEG